MSELGKALELNIQEQNQDCGCGCGGDSCSTHCGCGCGVIHVAPLGRSWSWWTHHGSLR